MHHVLLPPCKVVMRRGRVACRGIFHQWSGEMIKGVAGAKPSSRVNFIMQMLRQERRVYYETMLNICRRDMVFMSSCDKEREHHHAQI